MGKRKAPVFEYIFIIRLDSEGIPKKPSGFIFVVEAASYLQAKLKVQRICNFARNFPYHYGIKSTVLFTGDWQKDSVEYVLGEVMKIFHESALPLSAEAIRMRVVKIRNAARRFAEKNYSLFVKEE